MTPSTRSPSHASLDAARRFLLAEGRLLERRIAEVVFDRADPAAALAALRPYRNADGGFGQIGQTLEPDNRAAASQLLGDDLRGARFDRVDLRRAELHACDLSESRLKGVDLHGVVMRGSSSWTSGSAERSRRWW